MSVLRECRGLGFRGCRFGELVVSGRHGPFEADEYRRGRPGRYAAEV